MSEPIVLIGLPESGIAEVAAVLQRCGVHLDSPAITEFNKRLTTTLNDQQDAQPDSTGEAMLEPFRQEVHLLSQSLSPNADWGWMETNASPVLAFWQSEFPRMRIVICVRDPIDQARELAQVGDGMGFDEAITLWRALYQKLSVYRDQAVVTHYDTYLYNAPGEIKRVLSLLNITCDETTLTQAAALFEHMPAETPPEWMREYQQWCAHSGDVFQAVVAQSEQIELMRQNAELRRDADALENNIERLSELVQIAAEGRIRRFKRRVKTLVLRLLPDLVKTKPYRTAEYPEIALVTALDSHPRRFEATIRSILSQTSPGWQWIVACEDAPARLVKLSQTDARIRLYPLDSQQSAAEQWNTALKKATSPYVLPVFPGDRLAKAALADVGIILEKQPDIDCIYSDTTYQVGRRQTPFFKPDWSPAMMFSVNLLEGLFVFKRQMLARVGTLDPQIADGAYWDFCWRIAEQSQKIHHIPTILYHHTDTMETQNRGEVQKARLQRTDFLPVGVNPPRWKVSPPRKVSIIIPSRDKADLLGACLEKLFALTDYPDYEVIVVDTNSVEPSTFALYERYQSENRFRLIHYAKVDFNFSRACNLGAAQASGSLLLFLNNDTEVLHDDWLSLMGQWFSDASVGIVGPKLLYPDGKVQHAGVILGLSGLVNHIFQGCEENSETIFGSDRWYRNYLAVTGACLMISRPVFTEIGGFNEAYQLNFSDVEFCLRVYQHGYQVIYTPDVRLLHREAQTHRYKIPFGDFEQASRDFRYWLIQGDPFFNPNLSYTRTQPHISNFPFKTAYPNHLVAMKQIRSLANRQA